MKTRRVLSWLGTSVLAKMMLRTLAVLALSILIVEWVAYRESSKQIIALTEQQQLSLTALYAERFDRATDRIAADLQTIRNLPSMEEYFLNRQYDLHAEAEQQLENVSAFLTRVWQSDSGYARFEIADALGRLDLAVADGIRELPENRELTIFPNATSFVDGVIDEGISTLGSDNAEALVFSRILGDPSTPWGTVRVYYRLDSLTSALARERLAETGHLAVVANDGKLIFSPQGSALDQDALVGALAHLPEGTHEITAGGGQVLLVSASKLQSKDWKIAALVPKRELLAGLDTTLRLVVILIGINIAVEFVFIFWFARRFIIKPINNLLTGTREVLDGNYGHRVGISSKDEFGELAGSFNAMTTSLERTLAELRGREDELSRTEELLRQKLQQLEVEAAERERTAAALADQTGLLRALLSAIPAPIFHKDPDGAYLGCNEAFTEMLGLTEDEIIGKTVFDIAPLEHAKTWAKGDRDAMQAEGSISHEASVIDGEGKRRNYIVHKAVYRRGSKPGGVVGVMLDITERRALEAQLLHSQKLEAVGVLASGVAHDFNNVLQVIASYTRVLLREIESGAREYHALLQIQRSTDRAAELIRDMMTFSRRKAPQLQPVNLNAAINNGLRLIERTIPRMISVEHDLDPYLDRIEADPSQIEQILVNLATNARDAMPEGGVLRFTTSSEVLSEDFCRSRPTLDPGPYVVLRVIDSGVGMDPDIKDRVFEPFFTTKEVGVGTGLGLASVYGIVRAHGGHIECASKRGEGTEFSIYLPVPTTPARESVQRTPSVSSARGGGEAILIVDDDPGVLESTRMLLEAMGYEVETATSGEEALELWSDSERQRADLIILDLGMPGMGGRHCLRRLVELDPQVRVIVATGYASEQEETSMRDAGAVDFLGKPYRVEDLDRKIRTVLRQPRL